MEAKGQKLQLVASYMSISLFCLKIFIKDVSGLVTLTPSDVAVINGTNFSLRCSTDTTDDLWWYRLSPGATSEDHIVDGSEIDERFRSLYSVLHKNQKSVLMIVAVQSTAATYACTEVYTNERMTAQIIVLESEPTCLRNMNITGEYLNITCAVTFRGHGNPVIEWTRLTGKLENEVIVNTQRAGPPVVHISTLLVQTNESESSNFQVYSYQFTVTFCLPDNSTKTSDGRLCIFSKLIDIDKDVEESTPGIDEVHNGTTVGLGTEANGTTTSSTNDALGTTFVLGVVGSIMAIIIVFLIVFISFLLYQRFRFIRLNRATVIQHDEDEPRPEEADLMELQKGI